MNPTKKCKLCGGQFSFLSNRKIFCSRGCLTKYHNIRKVYPKVPPQSHICKYCEGTFTARAKVRYCSQKCNMNYWRFKMSKKEAIQNLFIKQCLTCKKKIIAKTTARKFCTDHCQKRFNTSLKLYKIPIDQYLDITHQCAFCDFTELIDCHHIISKSKGGKDILSNYIGLCLNHHGLIHRKKHTLKKHSFGWTLGAPKCTEK